MFEKIVRCFFVVLALIMTFVVVGCANDSAGAKKALQAQIDGLSIAYDGVIKDTITDDSFSEFESIGIDSSDYVGDIIKATSIEVVDVNTEESKASATIAVLHPDCDDLVRLMGEKADEFEASDDYLDFGQEERFARSRELLNEAIVGCSTKESSIEVKLSKSDSGWSVDDDIAKMVVGTLIAPEQTRSLITAMKPFSWKYDEMNASQVAEALKASGLPIGDIQAFDENTDPNGLLGRPGEYTSKAHFLDTRVHDEHGFDWFEGEINTDVGGTIEVFDNLNDAK